MIKILIRSLIIFLFSSLCINAEEIKKIDVIGNDRISKDTILMFSDIKINQEVTNDDLNKILKNLYETNFFENVEVSILNASLIIRVKEYPIIDKIAIEGIKNSKLKDLISDSIYFKPRYSFNNFFLEEDKIKISNSLKNLGYYFSKVDIFTETIDNQNKINLIYKIDLGEKAKIKKIYFTGDKVFKDSKLKSLIISEEYKPWKVISGKKYLNENTIQFDIKLLRNFYLNEGYYDVLINSSFAKLVDDKKFELIYNINANKQYFFNNIDLVLPDDFSSDNFSDIFKLFDNLKGKPYSINRIDNILSSLDKISTDEQFESVKSVVEENIIEDKINLKFIIQETKKVFVKKINILGNNITRESVLRNQLEVDEGDPYNEILLTKSINNLKSLNFFKSVNYNVRDSEISEEKIIDIVIEEKATGEIMALLV